MNDTSEGIRQQMDETRSQLTDKLESLEHQVSETVQSTGTAVNATVEAVQETVETVTGAVQDAVHSVSNAFDVRHQIDKHPWLVLGGAAVVGYLAFEFLKGSVKCSKSLEEVDSAPSVASESGWNCSAWDQLKGIAVGVLIGVIQDAASRAVPRVMDYVTGEQTRRSDRTSERRVIPKRKTSAVAAQRLHIAPSARVQSGEGVVVLS